MDDRQRRQDEDRLRERRDSQQTQDTLRLRGIRDAIHSTSDVDSAVNMAEALGILPAGTLARIDAERRREREFALATEVFLRASRYPFTWRELQLRTGSPPDGFLGNLVLEAPAALVGFGVRIWLNDALLCTFPLVSGLTIPLTGPRGQYSLTVRVYKEHSPHITTDDFLVEGVWTFRPAETGVRELRLGFRLDQGTGDWSGTISPLTHWLFLASPALPPADWAFQNDLLRLCVDGQPRHTWPLLPLVNLPVSLPAQTTRLTLQRLHPPEQARGPFRVVEEQHLDGRLLPAELIIAFFSVANGVFLPNPLALK